MRDVVRDAFVPFTAPLEGVVRHMYLDVKALVTVGIGNLIDPIQLALPLPFMRPDGTPAGRDEIAAEWLRLKSDLNAAHKGHRYAATITRLRLTDDGVRDLVARKLAQNDAFLQERFPGWEEWPADAQLGTLSMAWACGPAFRFARLEAALRKRDWLTAAQECRIDTTNNPGIIPRNAQNAMLYRNAALAEDPALLYWPRDLWEDGPEEETKPNRVPTMRPPPTHGEVVTFPIAHPKVPLEQFEDESLDERDSDPPPDAA